MRQPFPSEILDSDIRRVDTRAALDWLRAGWRDVRLAPVLSVTYGFVFTVLGWIIFNVTHELPWLFLSMVSAAFCWWRRSSPSGPGTLTAPSWAIDPARATDGPPTIWFDSPTSTRFPHKGYGFRGAIR